MSFPDNGLDSIQLSAEKLAKLTPSRFGAIVKALVQLAAGLVHRNDMRDLFIDIYEDVRGGAVMSHI